MLNDFQIENGKLLVRQTGASIHLTNEFVRDAASIALFTVEVSAITAARAARDSLKTRHRNRKIKIAFTPFTPQIWYAIWPVCHLAGIEMVNNIAQADILFYFEDSEFRENLPEGIDLGTAGRHVINGSCLDIRKSRVAGIFETVFGYPLTIDPRTHRGFALRKSERNGVHDGQIIPCPYLITKPEYTYQRLIENTRDGKIYTDIRTPVVGQSLPVIYLKNRTVSTRFSNDNTHVTLSDADEQFSPDEKEKILRFAALIGLEFGGLDILRDRADGRIYIVDVNKTDMGPPVALSRTGKLIAMQKLADAFKAYVTDRIDISTAA